MNFDWSLSVYKSSMLNKAVNVKISVTFCFWKTKHTGILNISNFFKQIKFEIRCNFNIVPSCCILISAHRLLPSNEWKD